MRLSRFVAAFVLIAMSCARQEQPEDDLMLDDPNGEAGSGSGKASGGGSGKAGSSSATAGKASGTSGSSTGGTTGAGGGGEEAGEGGGVAQGGKPSGGSGGKATAGSGGKATAGSAGSGGAGGSSAGTGGGGSGCMPSPGGPVAGFSARYENEVASTSGTSLGAQLAVYNTGSSTFNLTDLKIRYYLTNEVSASLTRNVNWAWLRPTAGGAETDIKSKISFNVVEMTCSTTNADAYLEFTFAADAGVLGPDKYILFSWSAFNAASESFNQSNDYSFSAGQAIEGDYAKVVVLQNSGTKLWGTEP